MNSRTLFSLLVFSVLIVHCGRAGATTPCTDFDELGLGTTTLAAASLRATAFATDGGLTYALSPGDGLVVLDLADPAAPVRIGSAPVSCVMEAIAVGGGYAFVAGAFCAGQVFDVSDPTQPAVIGSLPTGYPVSDLAWSDGHLYAVEAWPDYQQPGVVLHAFDVTDPTLPVAQAFTDTVSGLSPLSRQAALATRDGALWFATLPSTRIYSLADPSDPVQVGKLLNMERGIVFDGDLIYGASRSYVYVYEAIDPLVAHYRGLHGFSSPDIVALGAGSGHVAVGAGSQVHVLDVTEAPGLTYRGTTMISGTSVTALTVTDRVWAGAGSEGLWQIALGSGVPALPDWEFDFLDTAADAVRAGDMIHALTEVGLETWDVSDPAAPNHVGTIFGLAAGPGQGDLCLDGDLIIAAVSGTGVAFLRGAGTSLPTSLGVLPRPWARSVGLNGGLAWVLDNYTLVGIDYSVPGSPTVVATFDGPASSIRLAVGNGVAIAVNEGYAPWVVDISNPPNLELVARLTGTGPTRDAVIVDDRVAVACTDGRVLLWDISNPVLPGLLGGVDLSDVAIPNRIGLLGRYAYAGLENGTLAILDFNEPDQASVFELISWPAAGPVAILEVQPGSWLAAGNNGGRVRGYAPQCGASILPAPQMSVLVQGGVRLFQWEVPPTAEYVETCLYRGDQSGFETAEPVGCSAFGVVVDNFQGRGYYVARHRDNGGLWTAASNEIVIPSASDVPVSNENLIVTVSPNPFNPVTTINVALGRAEDVTIAVYDVSGRRVARLHNGPLTAGGHRFSWRGSDEQGRTQASGHYLVRVRTTTETRTRRLTLLK